jgi:putative ABC transport system substrate-binding protein
MVDAGIRLLEMELPATIFGTVWNPAEPNSAISVGRLREACAVRGLDLVERHAAATNELRDVTAAICQSGIDLLVISADNVTSSGFPVIETVCRQQRVPVYCTEPDLVSKGAAAAIGVDFYDWGRQSARLAAQILAGRDVGTMRAEEVESIKTVIATREEDGSSFVRSTSQERVD